MTEQERKKLADGHQVSLYVYDEQHNRMVKYVRERSLLYPDEPTYTVSQFMREANDEKLDRGVPKPEGDKP